jgi:hypothetical protein
MALDQALRAETCVNQHYCLGEKAISRGRVTYWAPGDADGLVLALLGDDRRLGPEAAYGWAAPDAGGASSIWGESRALSCCRWARAMSE